MRSNYDIEMEVVYDQALQTLSDVDFLTNLTPSKNRKIIFFIFWESLSSEYWLYSFEYNM